MNDEGKTGTTGGSSNGRHDTTPELRFSLAVAVRHPDIDAEAISVALDRTPYQAWQAGMPRRTPSGQPMPSVGRESYWIRTSEIRGQRNFFAALVEEADRLAACAALKRLAELPIDLGIEVCPDMP